jgi:hypothetical protein
MRKKSLVLLGAVLTGLAFHACSLPDSINRPKTITVKGSPDFDILLNISDVDVGRIFIDMIREQLADMGSDQFTVDVWEADYGQKEQAFLLKLSTTLTNSLNPDEYLNGAGFKHLDETSSEPFPLDYSVDMPPIKIEQTVGIAILPGAIAGDIVTLTADIVLPIPVTPIPENKTGFRHALIDKVEFEITSAENPGSSALTGSNPAFTFNAFQATDGSYTGLNGNGLSPENLEGEPINRNELIFSGGEIKINSGTTFEVSQNDIYAGKKNLTVTMTIKTLKTVKWDFEKVSDYFREMNFPPYSLAEPAGYVKELYFDQNDGTSNKGIGLKASFEKVIPGLLLNIKCEDIDVTDDEKKELKKGDIVFGNTDELMLNLEEYKDDDTKSLEYEIKLEPAANDKVLEIGNLTLGEEQELIKGEVSFFHCWTKAILDMNAIIRIANVSKDDFEGAVPNVFKEENPEEPIDLSMLKDYIDGGVTFDGIQTDVYISGPEGAFEKLAKRPNLEFSARRVSSPDETLGGGALYNDELKLGDPVKVDLENGRYKSGRLPPGGMEIENTPFTNLMEIILHEAPDDLYFQYNLDVDEYLEVTYEMFNAVTGALDEDENDIITVDVLVLLPLKLKVTDEGLRFLFKEYIGEQTDIFGREKPGEDAGFSNIKMPTLHVSLEFPEQFFSGGTIKLFTDDDGNDPLFPGGIPLNGRSIGINISGDTLNRILSLNEEEARLLKLNPFVEFAPGDTLSIPRNMGLMGIKFGISGDYTINADDLGLW